MPLLVRWIDGGVEMVRSRVFISDIYSKFSGRKKSEPNPIQKILDQKKIDPNSTQKISYWIGYTKFLDQIIGYPKTKKRNFQRKNS